MKTFDKTLGIFLLVLICTSTILVATANAEPATNPAGDWQPIVPPEPVEYNGPVEPSLQVYDVATGEVTKVPCNDPSQQSNEPDITFTEPYPGLLPSETTLETVFPPDGRVLVPYSTTATYPWRTICKIYIRAADGSGWMGSAAIIGPGQGGHGYFILTAGHCVYMHDHGGWVSSIEVIPGYDGAQAQQYQRTPYYHAWTTNMWTYTGWVYNKDWNHDMAFCKLDRNLGDFTGWMGRMTASPSHPVYTTILNTAGYPGDLSSGLRMYHDADYGRTATEYKHWYYMDTAGGQSGSPVWVYDYPGYPGRYILTVHAYGNDGTGSNSGTRLNSAKFNDIINLMNGQTPPTDKADLTDDGQSFSGFSPTTVYAGTTSFTVWCDVRNFGTASSGGFYVYYYASTDTTISPSDYLIGTDYISNIAALAYADSDWTGTFPANIPEGSYWVGWIIDATNLVSEFDEGNNKAYKTAYKLTVYRHTITFYTDPTTIGSITFAGTTYTNGQTGKYAGGTYTVTPNAPSGWTFSHWVTTGGVSISGSTATVTGTGTIKAVFTQIIVKYTITFYTDPSTIGSITFAGTTYTHGQTGLYAAASYSVSANAPSGWVFDHWETTGGVSISGSTATVTGTGTIKAVFNTYFEIWTDKTAPYHIGETMKVYVRVRNPGAALPVRAKIFLKLPDGTLYGPLLDMTTTIPAGYDSGNVLWQTFTIPSAPFGTYAWVAELRNPTTGALISQDTWNWQLSP